MLIASYVHLTNIVGFSGGMHSGCALLPQAKHQELVAQAARLEADVADLEEKV
jgi:outer membrane murein-binding lipoprotein Lpp